MSWFLREINESAGQIRLCMNDGRLIVGISKGIDITNKAEGELIFESNGLLFRIGDSEIADYVMV